MAPDGRAKPHRRSGLIAGATVALALAFFIALKFRPGLLAPPGLALWYAASLLVGGAAGLAGGTLAGRLVPRATAAVRHLAGALFGALGFLLQLWLFLLIMFRSRPASF